MLKSNDVNGDAGCETTQAAAAGGSGIVIASVAGGGDVYLDTSSVPNAPVTSPDGTTYIAQFKASATLNIRDTGCGTAFDYLVVAGGGSGGAQRAGGGGAGGFRTSFPGGTKLILSPGPNAITIGAGGSGNSSTGSENTGSNS